MLDEGAASLVQQWLASRGVAVHTGTTASAIRPQESHRVVELASGEPLPADLVILAIGQQPDLDFLVIRDISSGI